MHLTPIYLRKTYREFKLPSFISKYVPFVTVTVKAVTASLKTHRYLSLTEMLKNIVSGCGNILLFAVSAGLVTMLILVRMVYDIAKEKILSKLLSAHFAEVDSLIIAADFYFLNELEFIERT